MNKKVRRKPPGPPPIPREAKHFEPYYRRVLYFVFGAFLSILTLPFGCFLLLSNKVSFSQKPEIFITLFIWVVAYCGVWLIATSIRRELTLTPTSLTLRSAFTTRTVARQDIAYTEKMTLQGTTTLFLHSPHRKRAIMWLPFVFEYGDEVQAWMPNRR